MAVERKIGLADETFIRRTHVADTEDRSWEIVVFARPAIKAAAAAAAATQT
jgi:hypothetical protein